MGTNDAEQTVVAKKLSRRKLLQGAAIGGAGLATITALGAACGEEEQPAGAGATPAARTPATQTFDIIMGEGEIIGEVGEEEQIIGEFHRWEPNVLVAFKDDQIILRVKNPRKNVHSFILPDFGVSTGPLEGRTGEKTVTFTADKAGVFQFACATPFNHETGECDPDHERMVGYLIVLNA